MDDNVLDLTLDSPPPRAASPPNNRAAAASSAAIRLDDDDDEVEDQEDQDARAVKKQEKEEDDDALLSSNPIEEAGLRDCVDEPYERAAVARGAAAPAARRRGTDAENEDDDESSDDDYSQGATGKKQPGRKRGGGGAGKPPKKSKEEKELEREAAKAERAAKKEQEKQQKEWSKLVGDSQRGLYKNDEIVMVVDKRLRDTAVGKAIADTMRTGEFKAKQVFLAGPSCREEEEAVREEERYHPGMVRWARMPRPLWEDREACPRHSGPHVEQLGFVAVVWEARDFCDQLGLDTRGNLRVVGGFDLGVGGLTTTYQTLERVIKDIRLSPGMPAGARLVLILQGVQAEIALRWRRKGQESGGGGGACVTSDDYADALVWLLLSKGIEYKETKDATETAMYLREATRALAEMPFRDKATNLTSAAKGKAVVNSGGGGGVGAGGAGSTHHLSESDKIATAWARQLEIIPGMSDTKALFVVKNHHRTLRSLLNVYEDPSRTHEEKMNWLADKMDNTTRLNKALSTKIYQCLMVDDPNFLINDKEPTGTGDGGGGGGGGGGEKKK